MVDRAESIAYAMDLTPLVMDENLDIADYVDGVIGRFRNRVITSIKKRTGGWKTAD